MSLRIAILAAGIATVATTTLAEDVKSAPNKDVAASDEVTKSHYFILQTRIVQKDLALSAEQKEGVKRVRAAYEADVKQLAKKYLELSEEQRERTKLQGQISDAVSVHAGPQIRKLLTPAQFARLRQIRFQSQAGAAFLYEEFTRDLNLTESQQQTVNRNWKEFIEASKYPGDLFNPEQKMREAERDKRWSQWQENYWNLLRESFEKSVKVLNDEQRRHVEKLTGHPIDTRALSNQANEMKMEVAVGRRLTANTTETLNVQVSENGSFSVSVVKLQSKPGSTFEPTLPPE